ncbi:MAG: DUF493 domain-containing protein [Bacteroidales bacterium]|nr:DUF493 domain-containing protein [Bacteroidales bacterium]
MKNFHVHRSPGSNGHSKPGFPLVFDLKVIVDNQHPEEYSRAHLRTLFSQLEIPNTNWRSRLSAEGKYISFTIEVFVKTDEMMKKLYADLKTLPGIKLAL